MKKLFKEYGATALFYGGILAIFVFGFVIGAYGRSAPDATTADFGGKNTTEAEITVDEYQPPKVEETTEPEYTEITVTATAYCPCKKCCGKTDGITATGTKATAGRTIAVDPNVIPYGTELIIDGITYYAEDCGGAVKGDHVDIFFSTHEEAKQFGKRQLVAMIKN